MNTFEQELQNIFSISIIVPLEKYC